jgi:8-oxo-dGTP pyrophosphatase MutT (NUDIX family)
MSDIHVILAHPDVARLAQVLRERPMAAPLAATDGMRRAAVALIMRLTPGGELELLMIHRAEFPGDPWSGNVALPGGRQEPGDASLAQTAIRETREETGIDLTRYGRILGQLDEVRPQSPGAPSVIVTPFVAAVSGEIEITPSAEVAATFWVPIARLREPSLWTQTTLQVRGKPWQGRCFRHGDYIIWGLTERVLWQFFTLLTSI